MGKYRRYKNRIEMFLSSERGKRVLGFVYSWGASIVIIGALFKLLHLPYANQILFVAMITEAFVFFISGFERPSAEYHWEEVFPVLKSKNPMDRPDFAGGSVSTDPGGLDVQGNGSHEGGVSVGAPGGYNIGGGTIVIGGNIGGGMAGPGTPGDSIPDVAQGGAGGIFVQGAVGAGAPGVTVEKPSAESRVSAGMATMGLNISEEDSELLAESIKKLNNAAEQISKMADMSEVTQVYIEKISSVSENLDKFSEITGSLGEVSNTLVNTCKVISGSKEEGDEEKSVNYVEQMTHLNSNLVDLNKFYEAQLNAVRTQMDTVHQINAGLNRIRDMYDGSLIDSTAFRNENERMAQLLAQLNQVYSRLLHAMTVNMQAYPQQPPQQGGVYQQPPYQGGYPPQGGYR
jgi:gliding motility-associated protein GldL